MLEPRSHNVPRVRLADACGDASNMVDPLAILIEQAIITMSTGIVRPAATDDLFERLRGERDSAAGEAIENEIWRAWCGHAERDAREAMQRIQQAMRRGVLLSSRRISLPMGRSLRENMTRMCSPLVA